MCFSFCQIKIYMVIKNNFTTIIINLLRVYSFIFIQKSVNNIISAEDSAACIGPTLIYVFMNMFYWR